MSNQSHITVILDRTGSMESIRDDVIGGFNAFLQQQQALPEAASFTLVQFDSQDPYEVLHNIVPITLVRPLDRDTYSPRASTPLYDALGRGILDLEAGLASMRDIERPRHVVFVIVTDGQENASRDFDRARVARLIDAKKKLAWQFVFLSADLEAFVDAGRLGVDADARLHFSKDKWGNDAAWASASEKLSDFRSGKASKIAFDDKDKGAQPRQ
jgi:hypothetical protein